MIIENSSMVLASAQSRVQEYKESEALTAWVRDSVPVDQPGPGGDKISITEKALKHLKRDIEKTLKHLEKGLGKAIEDMEEDSDSEEVKRINVGSHEATRLGLVKKLVEAFTGEKIKLSDLEEWSKRIGEDDDHDDEDNDSSGSVNEMQRWGVVYNRHVSYYESEQMSFNAAGIIRTADGREINFSLDLMMSREFMYESNVSFAASGISAGNVIIDFAGPASELSNSAFTFGLEPEDDNETVSYLAVGSGLLSIDLNNDGAINGLNELFGPSTGNGFAELAAYDEDGNGWIDENDSVYDQLKIWTQDSEGNAVLSGLKESNVGAIYLGSVSSEFSLRNAENMLVGQIERSGIYLGEDGTPGTIQQLSIMV